MEIQFSSIQFNCMSIQFSSVQFSSIQFNSISIQFNSSSIHFNSVQCNSIQFIQFNSIHFNSVQFHSSQIQSTSIFLHIDHRRERCSHVKRLYVAGSAIGTRVSMATTHVATSHCRWSPCYKACMSIGQYMASSRAQK